MKTIKRMSQLLNEQKRLHRRAEELEKDIRDDWRSIRRHFEPAGLAREALSSAVSVISRKWLHTGKS
ncbi:MAG: hypothetical protein Q8927_05395 [Bacteroidota bacterium]|nr:hypothetical protein [Bacteroidota bacterium]